MPCYYPAIHYGGPITAVHQMNKALIKQGMDITVFTTNANGSMKLDVPTCEEVDVDGVKVHYFPTFFRERYFYSPMLKQGLRKALEKFDVVHINWLYVYPTMIAARLCTKMGIPYVLTPHGMLDSYSSSIKSLWKKKLYINFIEKKHIKNAAFVHYSSSGEQEEAVISDWDINTTIIPNGVDLHLGESFLSKENPIYTKYPEILQKKLVLFIGRLNYIKGLDLLLKAWPCVADNVGNAHLVIAGPDSNGYLAKLQDMAMTEGVIDSVTFTGIVLGEEKDALLSASNVFVSSSYLESFGMAIVEAMSFGLPVAITDRVNIKTEIESAKAGLVSSCEPQSIAENLIYLLNNSEKAKQMGMRGQALAMERFELSSVADQMDTLYQQISRKDQTP